MKKYLAKFVKFDILVATGASKGRKYQLNEEIIRA